MGDYTRSRAMDFPVMEEESTKCHGLILFLMLEFCDMDLECWLEENSATSSPGQKWDIFNQTVQGIQAVHSQNIIHRDIKPQNILIKLDAEGKVNVKLADFGLSRNNPTNVSARSVKMSNDKPTQDESVSISKSRTAMTKVGTLAYVAPEIINSRVAIYTEKSDVWTLGAVLARMFDMLPGSARDEDLDSHQRAAKSIVRKLCVYFPSDRPSVEEVAKLTHPERIREMTNAQSKAKRDSELQD